MGCGIRDVATWMYQPKLRGSFVALSILVAVSHLHVMTAAAQGSVCQNLAPSPTLTPFVDQLPIPASISVNSTTIRIGAYKITQKLHRDLPPTTLYAYGQSANTATYPGPTLEATRGVPANVYWENHIPDAQHFLPVDTTIHWAMPRNGGVPIVVHLHGAELQSTYDGHPDAWWTPSNERGPTYTTQNYTYPNGQRPTMLWYHDHVVGITRLNVVAGLTGLYMLRSQREKNLTDMFSPRKFEIPFVIKDLQFWPNGSINFPNVGDSPTIHPSWCPEYFGDTILVNGKVWPYLNVYPRFYRFRILNGANARFFSLTLSNPNLKFIKIGTDGGFLPSPQTVSSLLLSPAERVDVLIDFSSLRPGDVVYVNNSAAAPFPNGDPAHSPPQTNTVMKIQVVAWPATNANQNASPQGADVNNAVSQAASESVPFINYSTALHRHLLLQEFYDANGNPIISTLGNKTWEDPVTELPQEGATEVWEMINTTPDAHPMHVHLIQFHVLNQQPYDVARFVNGSCDISVDYPNAGTCFTGPANPPAVYQTGFKDTAIVWPGNVTRYGIRFLTSNGSLFPFDPTVGPGYVWHCHILDHEDNDMMRPYKVVH